MNGVVAVKPSQHKGYSKFVQIATVQKEAFPLAGGLTIVNVQTLAHNLTKPDTQRHKAAFYMRDCSLCKSRAAHQSPEFIGDCHSAKFSAENLSNPDIGKGAGGSAEGLSDLTTRGADEFKDTLGGSFATSTREEFSEAIKKGSTTNAALFLCASANHLLGVSALVLCCAISMIARISSAALVPISSIFASDDRALLRLEISLFSSLSVRRRRSISPCMAVTMKPALLSPTVFTDSIPSTTSWGMRAVTDWDFALVELVAINQLSGNWCLTVYTKVNYTKELMCKPLGFIFNYTLSTGKAQAAHKIAKPSSATTLTGPLTTTVKPSNEVVMSKHTTPLNGRNAHTQDSERHPVFIWLIAAVRRDCPSIVAVIHHIPAESEQAARRTLAKEHVCFFAGRLNAPRQEVRHV